MYTPHAHCRACGYAKITTPSGIKVAPPKEKLIPVFSLGVQPLANDFVKPGEQRAGYAPLEVLLCPQCDLAQLSVVVKPEILYTHYAYETSPSKTMRAHFEALWADISAGRTINSVLEIGSNDGALLSYLKFACGVTRVLGIDPAENRVADARKLGVETIQGFFNREMAEMITHNRGWDLVLARHVLCHCDDWHDFFAGLEALCGKDTVICIETPDVEKMLANNSFDQIYHEHLSYLPIKAMQAVLKGTNLHLHRVIKYPIHGGALLFMIQRNDCGNFIHPSVEEFSKAENVDRAKWGAFSRRAVSLVADLSNRLHQYQQEGKQIAALGATAKSTVWINACGFKRKHIAFIADSTSWKQGTTSPGSDIPIVDEGAILRELPDYVILFAWNFAVECLEKNMLAISKGVKFIIPVPSIQIVGKAGEKIE